MDDKDNSDKITPDTDPWTDAFSGATDPNSIDLTPFLDDTDDEVTKEHCMHLKKYLNQVSPNLQFYYCPDCKHEVKDDE